jgi:hypothetical protein
VIRQALGTPSWADTLKRTEIILAGFNPELAAARAAIEEKKQKRRTVHAHVIFGSIGRRESSRSR